MTTGGHDTASTDEDELFAQHLAVEQLPDRAAIGLPYLSTLLIFPYMLPQANKRRQVVHRYHRGDPDTQRKHFEGWTLGRLHQH